MLLGGVVAAATLSSCATFDSNTAATVNGTDISVDQLDAIRTGLAEQPASFQLDTANFDDTGAANGELTRQALSLLIDNEVIRTALDDAGAPVTDEALAAVSDQLSASGGDTGLPAAVQAALAYQSAGSAALDALEPADPASFETAYNERPASTGVVCLEIASAPTEAEAQAAADALAAGTPVATSDTVAVNDGCVPLNTLASAFPPEDVAWFLAAGPGDVSEIFPPSAADTASYQVIKMQTWDDALEKFTTVVTSSPGDLAKAAAFLTADIAVASEYGRWDVVSQSVVPV